MLFSDTLRRWAAEDLLVQDAAYRRNLQVLGVASWAVVALNLLHVLVFALLRFDDAQRSTWASQITAAHGAMAVVMSAAGLLTWYAQKNAAPRLALKFLPEGVSVLILAWAVALTLMDQAISANINAFINAAVGISIVFLLRPLSTLVILAFGWCALALALGWTTDNAALLATNRMNAASASALALLVSILLWRRYVQAELLQRALEESNQQLERQRAELETLATRDPLTGLFNRREFVRLAEEELARARRNHSALSLLMIDLDHFKTINDKFGHPTGDDVLRNVAGLMERSVRQTDRVARFGGEEFMLLLPDTSAADALHLANKLRQELADTPIASIGAPVTASMGLACMPAGKTLALDTLLRQTDQALYQAKHMGRNRTVVAPVELETLASARHSSTTHKTNTPAP